jgi:hypothetical protein
MHIGWVPDDSGGGYHAQMAVLVKPNGWRGKAYMAGIKPFRYALVYPMLLRSIGRQWHATDRVRRVRVSDPIAAARPHDYADAFELQLEGPDRCSPEEWVRAGVEATPAWIKRVAGHADGLGSARIAESDAEVVVLEDSDPLSDVVMIGRNVEPDRRVLTTVLRYRRPLLAPGSGRSLGSSTGGRHGTLWQADCRRNDRLRGRACRSCICLITRCAVAEFTAFAQTMWWASNGVELYRGTEAGSRSGNWNRGKIAGSRKAVTLTIKSPRSVRTSSAIGK